MTDSTDRTDIEKGSKEVPTGRNGRDRPGGSEVASTTSLSDVIDAIPDVFYVVDEEWTFLQWNDRLRAATGYTDEEIARMHPLELVPESDHEVITRAVLSVFEHGGIETWETEIVTKTGEQIPFECNGAGITNEAGEVVAMAGTARCAAARARQRNLVSRVLETSPVGIVVLDAERRVVRTNDRAEEIIGAEQAAMSGQRYTDIEWEAYDIDGQPLKPGKGVIARAFATGEAAFDSEYRFERPGADPRWLSVSAAPIFDTDGELERVVVAMEDITERHEYERRLRRERDLTARIVETSPVGIVVLDPGGTIIDANARVAAIVGLAEEELVGMNYTDPEWYVFDDDGERLAPDEWVFERALGRGETVYGREGVIERADGERQWVSVSVAPVRDGEGNLERIVAAVVDVTDRRERERELEHQRRELERLDRINAIIRRTNQALVGAVTREGIERTVCEHLTDSEAYAFAWIGEPQPTEGEIEARTWAGDRGDYLEEVSITVENGDEATSRGPTGRAIRSRTVETAGDISEDPAFAPWREAATERGFRSSAAVPLVYDDVLYGVLNLYAERPNGFSEEEQEVLAELGETIGYAINATQSKRLLFTDRAVELEFRSDSTASFFIDATDRVGGTIVLEGVVPSAGEGDLYYMTLRDASPEEVLDLAADTPGIEGRLVGESDGEYRLEFRVGGASITRSLLGQGAQVKDARATEGEARITAEIAPDTDVRTVVEAVRELFPGSELVAKRDVERETRTTREFRETVEEELTDRQAAALKAAFYTGYFEWPRASSAEEVAETMDIASPTFHQHLRAAHRKLLRAFFEE